MIRFSGTAGQVEQAFQTQMHYYTVAGEKHFAPSTALTLPSALAPVVTASPKPRRLPPPAHDSKTSRARPGQSRLHLQCFR